MSPAPTLTGVLAETAIGFPAAAAMMPASRGAKKAAVSTLIRWAKLGVLVGDQRVKLEAVKTGVWWTSVEAVQRFLATVTAGSGGQESPLTTAPTPTQRRKAGEAAQRRLIAMGM